MNFGNKERIIFGIVGAILLIGALHMFVFRSNANQYRQSLDNFSAIIAQFQSQQVPKGKPVIYDFDYKTMNYGIEFWEMFKNTDIAVPADLKTGSITPEEAEVMKIENFIYIYDTFIDDLLSRPDSESLTELTFLRSDSRWQFYSELPESVSNSNTAVSDLLRDLKDTDAIIKETTEGSQLWLQKEPQYLQQLNQFGLNTLRREWMEENFGVYVAMMYTLNRVSLVRDAVEKTEVGIFDDLEYDLFLLDLFRFDDYELFEKNTYEAFEAMNEIIDACDRSNIDEIVNMKVGKIRDIRWPPKEDTEPDEEEAATNMMFDDGMMGFEERMFMGMDGGGRGSERGAAAAAAAAAEEEAQKDVIAGAIPIEVSMIGTNTDVMNVIYELSKSSRHYHVDRLVLSAQPQNDNKVAATFVVQATSFYLDGYIGEDIVDQNLEKLIKNKNWLAIEGDIETEEDFTPDPDNAEEPEYRG